jgi:4-alpha-glucanotransferase
MRRITQNLKLYDMVRIDHFRAFAAHWEVPAKDKTAVNGTWQHGPGARFFDRLQRRFPSLPIVAEDLGLITADVRELKERFRLPGMKILQYAFFDDPTKNPYMPYNVDENAVMYTGTHDNNTTRGWYEQEIDAGIKQRLNDYTGQNVTADNVHWVCIRLSMGTVARYAVFPVQDILGLGPDARMNTPSSGTGNWAWRLLPGQLTADLARLLAHLTETYGRAEPILPAEPQDKGTN